jgi:rSAM/selenodomain-associated transferase 2
MAITVSIIIPVLHESERINGTLSSLLRLDGITTSEIIVVDGDPAGSTLKSIQNPTIQHLISRKGRGNQMNAGARTARGDILLFLHADTRLPETAFRAVARLKADRNLAAGAFDLGIRKRGLVYRIIERSASIRSRFTHIPYGDQAVFVKRDWFFRVGGYPSFPVMEDVDFMIRLKRAGGNVRIFPERVGTSARRWETDGVIMGTLRNWLVRGLYHSGVSPDVLKKFYPEYSGGADRK